MNSKSEVLIKLMEAKWDIILERSKSTNPNSKIVLQNLKEVIERLAFRLAELEVASGELGAELRGKTSNGLPLHNCQLIYMDKVEGYHQQVYCVISALSNYFSYFHVSGFKNQHSISSNKRFLETILASNQDNRIHESVNTLIKSIEFRAKYIDHPQQHLAHDWMTYAWQDKDFRKVYIIYFIRAGDKVYHRHGAKDPESPYFKCPMECGDNFYVSPYAWSTHDALHDLITRLLDLR